MKVVKFISIWSILVSMMFSMSLIMSSCKRDDDQFHNSGENYVDLDILGPARSVDVMGLITDESGNPVNGAVVSAGFGLQTTLTDERGFFILRGIMGHQNLALVKVSKEGYFDGSRSFIPGLGMNKIRIEMLAKNVAGSFGSAVGGTVSLENLEIVFGANVIGYNGTPYNGNVNVAINYIDPTQLPAMNRQMPGNLFGFLGSELSLLKSYGMAGVELTDDNGNTLQILPGSSATVHFTVPGELLNDVPSEIPLWHYDEDAGYWVSEGSAALQGNTYVGSVSHFSFWNCDVSIDALNFECTVYDASHSAPGQTPVSGIMIELFSPSAGSSYGFTDSNGSVSGFIPPNEELVLNVYLDCAGTAQLVYSESIGPYTSDTSIDVNITEILGPVCVLHGQLLNAEQQPTEGVVFLNDWDFTFTTAGYYHFLTCINQSSIIGWFYSGNDICSSQPIVLDLTNGELEQNIFCDGCSQMFASGDGVTDVQGNFYPTVIIGNQEWLAENLKTANYQNGDPILEMVTNAEWSSANQGGWCYYGNLPTNEDLYGKLYNWHAVVDSRNVCPAGFHVPDDNDWNEVKSFLIPIVGSVELVGNALKTTGTLQQGNGLWNEPNTGANNLTQFSGLPGGTRFGSGGFYQMGNKGFWWSATTLGNNSARMISMSSDSSSVHHTTAPEENGFSVRCMRDL
jgi:uncharacterized protein (TIGR02145 family)